MPSKNSLSDKEIDVLKFISKTHRDLHEKRIKRELQVVITSLTFYAACVAFKINSKFPLGEAFSIISIFTFIIIAIYVFLYMEGSGQSNNINQKVAEEAENRLSELLDSCLYNRDSIIKEVKDKNPRWSYKATDCIAELLRVNLKLEIIHSTTKRGQWIITISKILGIELETKEEKDDHPSANRWLWQASIVILGAFIANILIDYCWGTFSDIFLIFLIILARGAGKRSASRL